MEAGIVSEHIDFLIFSFFMVSIWTDHLSNLSEAATEFAISLLQTLVVDESSVISELHNLVDALAKVCVVCELLEDSSLVLF